MKRFLSLVLSTIVILGAISGCAKKPAAQEPSASSQTEAPATNPSQPANDSSTGAPAADPAADAPETAFPSVSGDGLFAGLTFEDAAIVIDGVLYKSWDPYSKFVENGWDFSFDDYNVDETYVLNSGDYVLGDVDLKNVDKYGAAYYNPAIEISFINTGDKPTVLKECAVRNISVEGFHGFSRYEDLSSNACPCYDFEIIGGIRRGASLDEVKAVFGEPKSVYNSDHYDVLTYEGDRVTYKLTVFSSPDIGLQGVDITNTRRVG